MDTHDKALWQPLEKTYTKVLQVFSKTSGLSIASCHEICKPGILAICERVLDYTAEKAAKKHR